METFEIAKIGNTAVKNRIIRSVSWEGMCDTGGLPTEGYYQAYKDLALCDIGTIITGPAFISNDGRSSSKGQLGINSDSNIAELRKFTDSIRQYNCKLFVQLSHAGKSDERNTEDRSTVSMADRLSTGQVHTIIEQFGYAAYRAQQSGFDGIEVDASHGHLVHQFLLPSHNHRSDHFSIDRNAEIGTMMLSLIIENIREKCGSLFPVIIRINCGSNYVNEFSIEQFINLILFLNSKNIDAVEMDFGATGKQSNYHKTGISLLETLACQSAHEEPGSTLNYKLSMSSADSILTTSQQALQYTRIAKDFYTEIPIICHCGLQDMGKAFLLIEQGELDFVSLSRPFVYDPDLISKLLRVKDNHAMKN